MSCGSLWHNSHFIVSTFAGAVATTGVPAGDAAVFPGVSFEVADGVFSDVATGVSVVVFDSFDEPPMTK